MWSDIPQTHSRWSIASGVELAVWSRVALNYTNLLSSCVDLGLQQPVLLVSLWSDGGDNVNRTVVDLEPQGVGAELLEDD